MDMDDHPPVRPDFVAQLAREDLDPLSAGELDARVAGLEAEIARTRAHAARAAAHRASADQLFRR